MDILIIADFCGGLDGQGKNRFIYLANLLAREHEVEILTSDFNHGKKNYFQSVPKTFPFKITMVHEGLYCNLRTPSDGFAEQNGRDAERAD